MKIRSIAQGALPGLVLCQTCECILNNENWTASMQKYGRYICSKCWTARQKAYNSKNPNIKEQRNEQRKKREDKWSSERKFQENRKRYGNWIKRKYGITIEEYECLLYNQDNKCAICFSSDPKGKGGFHIDHCHESGKIRGILCSMCNLMLGKAGDDPALLRRAANYIEINSTPPTNPQPQSPAQPG